MLVVKGFPNAFEDDLSGVPHVIQVEFRIDLIHCVAPIAKELYHLTPSKMHELSS